MSVTKEVLLQLKINRPKDGNAFKETSAQAKELEGKLKSIGGSGSAAMGDVMSRAARLRDELGRGRAAVNAYGSELTKISKDAAGIASLTKQFVELGVAEKHAQAAAVKLHQSISAGARVAEADVKRLAATMRSLGYGSGPGGPPRSGGGGGGSGGGGTRRENFSSGLLGMLGGAGFAAGALQAGFRGVTEAYRTSADDEIRSNMDGVGRFATSYRHGLPVVGAAFEAYDSWRTSDAREGAARSIRQTARVRTEDERARGRGAINAAGDLRAREAVGNERRDYGVAMSTAAGLRLEARERVEAFDSELRRTARDRQLEDELREFREGRFTGGRSMRAFAAETRRPFDVGAGERRRVADERAIAEADVARAEESHRRAQTPTYGGPDPARAMQEGAGRNPVEALAALREMETARQRLVDIARREVELTGRISEQVRQQLEVRRQEAQVREQTWRIEAQRERDARTSFTRRFGLMDNNDQANLLLYSRQAQADDGRGIQTLGPEALQALQGTGLMDAQVNAEAERRSQLAGVQQILRSSGVDQRISQAEQQQAQAARIQVQLQSEIRANINLDANAMASQIANVLAPALTAVRDQILRSVPIEVERQIGLNNLQAGRP